jgi:hypothetical protein
MRSASGHAVVRACLLALTAAGCHGDSTAAPSTTTTTETAASPTVTDSYTGQLSVRGTMVDSFDVGAYGTVNASLVSVTGNGVPSSVQLRVGLGTMTDGACTTTTASLTTAGSTTPVTATLAAGSYCVVVADVGNLYATADVSFQVAHP